MNAPPKAVKVKLARTMSLVGQIPYWFLDGPAVILHDGTIGYGWELIPQDIGIVQDEYVDSLSRAGEVALRALPVGSVAQFLLIQAPITDWSNYETALSPTNPILSRLRSDNRKILEAKRFRGRRLYVFVTIPHVIGKVIHEQSSGLMVDLVSRWYRKVISSTKLPSEITQIQHQEACEQVRGIGDAFVSGLAKPPLALQPRLLEGKELLNPIRSMMNFTQVTQSTANIEEILHSPSAIISGLSLRQHLVTSSMVHEPNNLFVGDPLVPGRALLLADPPGKTKTGMGKFLSELDCGRYAVSYVIRVGDQRSRFRKLEGGRRRAHARARSGAGDVEAAAREANITQAMERLTTQGYAIYDVNLSIFFVAPDIYTLNEASTNIKLKADGNGLKLVEANMRHFECWRGMLPFAGHFIGHDIPVMTDHAADMMPVFGNSIGQTTPHIVFGVKPSMDASQNVVGDAFGFTPTDRKRINYNESVFGQSGQGKSFKVISDILQGYLPTGAPLIVIDVGGGKDGSYYRLCQLMGGNYIQIDAGGKTAFNPFFKKDVLFTDEDTGAPSTTPNEDLLNRMVALVSTLVVEKDTTLGVLEEAALRTAILRAYSKSSSPTLRLVHEVLTQAYGVKSDDDRAIWRLLMRRLTAALDSTMGRIFGGEHQLQVDTSRQMVVYDLMGVEALGHRGAALILLISNAIADMRNRPGRFGIARVIWDECAILLQNAIVAAILIKDYRVARKYGYGVTGISQSVDDFLAIPGCETIIRNSSAIWALGQLPADAEKVGKICNLNEAEVQAIASAASVKGKYSEIFLKDMSSVHTSSRVLRLYPSPFLYWLATTDSTDKEIEAQVRKETGRTGIHLIEELGRCYPNGAVWGKQHQPRPM